MEWIQERAEEFSVMAADKGSPAPLLGFLDLVTLLGLSHYLFSKAPFLPFSIFFGARMTNSSLNKMDSVFPVWWNNGNYFARIHW